MLFLLRTQSAWPRPDSLVAAAADRFDVVWRRQRRLCRACSAADRAAEAPASDTGPGPPSAASPRGEGRPRPVGSPAASVGARRDGRVGAPPHGTRPRVLGPVGGRWAGGLSRRGQQPAAAGPDGAPEGPAGYLARGRSKGWRRGSGRPTGPVAPGRHRRDHLRARRCPSGPRPEPGRRRPGALAHAPAVFPVAGARGVRVRPCRPGASPFVVRPGHGGGGGRPFTRRGAASVAVSPILGRRQPGRVSGRRPVGRRGRVTGPVVGPLRLGHRPGRGGGSPPPLPGRGSKVGRSKARPAMFAVAGATSATSATSSRPPACGAASSAGLRCRGVLAAATASSARSPTAAVSAAPGRAAAAASGRAWGGLRGRRLGSARSVVVGRGPWGKVQCRSPSWGTASLAGAGRRSWSVGLLSRSWSWLQSWCGDAGRAGHWVTLAVWHISCIRRGMIQIVGTRSVLGGVVWEGGMTPQLLAPCCVEKGRGVRVVPRPSARTPAEPWPLSGCPGRMAACCRSAWRMRKRWPRSPKTCSSTCPASPHRTGANRPAAAYRRVGGRQPRPPGQSRRRLASIARNQQQIGQLQQRLADAKARLNTDSSNSSLQPSSDPLPHQRRPPPTADQPCKKPRGQPGRPPRASAAAHRPGRTNHPRTDGLLLLWPAPDGHGLGLPLRHQVAELPVVRPGRCGIPAPSLEMPVLSHLDLRDALLATCAATSARVWRPPWPCWRGYWLGLRPWPPTCGAWTSPVVTVVSKLRRHTAEALLMPWVEVALHVRTQNVNIDDGGVRPGNGFSQGRGDTGRCITSPKVASAAVAWGLAGQGLRGGGYLRPPEVVLVDQTLVV